MLYVLCFILIAGVGLLLYGWWDTNRFRLRKMEIELDRLPKAFDGYTILQVSDLHNRAYGPDGLALIRAIQGLSFDCVAIIGDLLDRHMPEQRKNGYRFASEAVELGPTYCIEGNHEQNIGWAQIMEDLTRRNVRVLNNEAVMIQRGDAMLELIGSKNMATETEIQALVLPDICSVLLAHHPERIEVYARTGVDLVLSGHAHGGQVRLFGLGLFSPDQGVLPRYTSGIYTCCKTKLYVSRGAGTHSFLPPRIFNRPEIDLITLKTPSR